jgi:hypothetical protein
VEEDLATEGLEKCIQLNVLIVTKNQLYLFAQEAIGQFIAVTAMNLVVVKLQAQKQLNQLNNN